MHVVGEVKTLVINQYYVVYTIPLYYRQVFDEVSNRVIFLGIVLVFA